MTKTCVLALFNQNLETSVFADASSYGLGAVQQEGGEIKPVAFVSRALTPTEDMHRLKKIDHTEGRTKLSPSFKRKWLRPWEQLFKVSP
jgi:hypothetical protein